MIGQIIKLFLENFPIIMYVLAIVISLFSGGISSKRMFALMLFMAVGLSGIWGFAMHVFFPSIASKDIGWQANSFEFEVGLANLGLGISGIIAAFASWGYRAAVTTVTTTFLWGAAIGHIRQIILLHNYNPGNAGTILVTDILIPLTLLILLAISYTRVRKDLIYFSSSIEKQLGNIDSSSAENLLRTCWASNIYFRQAFTNNINPSKWNMIFY